jgi:MSHA biogenesis protein MshJ
MKDVWKRWSRRIDALSVRERVILFASIAFALVAATDALVLSPRAAEQRTLTLRLRAQFTEIDGLRQQLGAADASTLSPAGRALQELRALQGERDEVEAEIARRVADGSDGTRLGPLLERVLRRHERLTLLKLATGATVVARPGAPPLQGVELGVRGSYLDLAQYLSDLERSLPGLRWEALSITRHDGAAELQARVALLGEPR